LIRRWEELPLSEAVRAGIDAFLVAVMMALQFGEDVMTPESIDKRFIGIAREADESFGELGKLLWCGCSFALLRP